MAELLMRSSRILFWAALVLFVCSVFLWVKLHVWAILGELSGRTARKSIADMRKRNEAWGCKSLRPGAVALGTLPEGYGDRGSRPLSALPGAGTEAATECLQGGRSKRLSKAESPEWSMIEEVILIHTDEWIAVPYERKEERDDEQI